MESRFLLICLLLLAAPACALFLAGSAQPGGEVSILCEGQRQAFVSSPSGGSRALLLDSGGQASFYPDEAGPHTIQCGNQTKTISVSLAAQPSSLPAGSEGSFFLPVLALAIIIAAAALAALSRFTRRRTEFSKQERDGRVELRVFAAEELRSIRISDPDAEHELRIPRLAAGAGWGWEYERAADGMLLAPAHLSAKTAKGEIHLLSGRSAGVKEKRKVREKRQLPKSSAA